ncbi:MAG: hypothetical protein ACKVZJ_07420 [Phycisphaerales bacterium]
MPKHVFILGAGASAQGGCPVMGNFFKCADRIGERGEFDEFQHDWQTVRQLRERLQRASIKGSIDIENIESVLNAIEMADFLGLDWLKDIAPQQDSARFLRGSLVRLIAATLERTQVCTGDYIESNLSYALSSPLANSFCRSVQLGPCGYDEMAILFRRIIEHPSSSSVSCITFNYDIGLEYALACRGVGYTYALNDEPTDRQVVPILKLHGSTNWAAADGRIVEIGRPNLDWTWERRRRFGVVELGAGARMLCTSAAVKKWLSSNPSSEAPIIVPPSESKSAERPQHKKIWRRAARELSDADYVVISGYSMPATDEFFRQFWAVSSVGDALRKRVIVSVVGDSQQLANKYRALVGPSYCDQCRIEFLPTEFLGLVKNLIHRYQDSDGTLDL